MCFHSGIIPSVEVASTCQKSKNFISWNRNDFKICETFDMEDTNYNSDSWESEFVTIIVTWQLRVTVDSIRNSCDVLTGPTLKFL